MLGLPHWWLTSANRPDLFLKMAADGKACLKTTGGGGCTSPSHSGALEANQGAEVSMQAVFEHIDFRTPA